MRYHIAGNFRMVEIFVYFVLKSIIRKFKLANISVFYVTMLSCDEYLNYEILKWVHVVHTKMCTNENYPLYGTAIWWIHH